MEWLTARTEPVRLSDLRKHVTENSITPEQSNRKIFGAWRQDLPYRLKFAHRKSAVDGCCDVVLRRRNAQGEVADLRSRRDFPGESGRPFGRGRPTPIIRCGSGLRAS